MILRAVNRWRNPASRMKDEDLLDIKFSAMEILERVLGAGEWFRLDA